MINMAFAVTDEGDEGASSLLDMTKVTRSTLGVYILSSIIGRKNYVDQNEQECETELLY